MSIAKAHITTPAKLILSGEHSVCYGAPAVGTPLAMYLHTTWQLREDSSIVLKFNEDCFELAETWQSLSAPLAGFRARYEDFIHGRSDGVPILPRPQDLVTLTLAMFYEHFAPRDMPGLNISIASQIPVSSGMGSSSAVIINILRGALQTAGLEMAQNEMLDLARRIEDFQHGTSSGLDLALVSGARPLLFNKKDGILRLLPDLGRDLCLVYTGKPENSTGECVRAVSQKFGKDEKLWADFSACTHGILQALETKDATLLQAGVRKNHALLCHIGVVPEKTRDMIKDCEAAGMAAKICGAGALTGSAAGMVWVIGNEKNDETLNEITLKYRMSYDRYATG